MDWFRAVALKGCADCGEVLGGEDSGVIKVLVVELVSDLEREVETRG